MNAWFLGAIRFQQCITDAGYFLPWIFLISIFKQSWNTCFTLCRSFSLSLLALFCATITSKIQKVHCKLTYVTHHQVKSSVVIEKTECIQTYNLCSLLVLSSTCWFFVQGSPCSGSSPQSQILVLAILDSSPWESQSFGLNLHGSSRSSHYRFNTVISLDALCEINYTLTIS